MKKPLAIVILTIGNALLTLSLGIAALLICMLIFGFGIALDVLLLAGHIVGAMLLQRLYQKRGWLSPAKYWLCAAVPAAGISVVSFLLVLYLDSIGHFSGFFAGLGEFLLTFSGLIYSGAFLLILGAALLIKYRQSKALVAVVGFVVSVGFALGLMVFYDPLCIAVVGAVHIVGAALTQHFLERKTGLSAFRFWALAAAPAAIITGIFYLVQTIIGNGYHLFSCAFMYCFPAAVVLGAVLLLKSLIRRKNSHTTLGG
ncbi:MAG: hypothetical protein ACI4WS_07165 [Oscillospiraceae bacterium]